MANVSGASLNGIYNRLHDAPEYHPLSANTFADWSLEAGDIVTVTRDGKSYASPAMNNTTVWRKKQQVTVNATGKEQRDTVATMSKRKFRGGGASLRATQKAFDQIITSYNEMTAGLVLASSTAHLYVDNMYTQMKSGLYLTASTAHLYVDNKYRQMTAGLNLTSSTAKLYVDNKYSQMTAGLNLTSSTAKLYVDNKYSQMKAGLYLTSSDAHLYVDNRYSQMASGLVLSESSARLYARSAENAAEIVARINESTGQSEIQLDAEKVYIGNQRSTTVISGKLNATDVTADYIKGKIASISSVSMQSLVASSIQFSVGGGLYGNPENAIMNLQLYQSGNSYQIWGSKFNGEIVKTASFSRAVSSWDWTGGNGQVKVTAQPQNQTLGVDVRVNGDATITSNGTYTYKAQYEDDNGSYWDIGGEGTKTITVSVPATAPPDIGIYDAYAAIIPSQTISPGNSIDLWAGCNIGQTGEAWGSKVTITAGTYPSRTMRCSGKEQTYPGSTTYKYTFTIEGSYSFSEGSNYTFYRTGWS